MINLKELEKENFYLLNDIRSFKKAYNLIISEIRNERYKFPNFIERRLDGIIKGSFIELSEKRKLEENIIIDIERRLDDNDNEDFLSKITEYFRNEKENNNKYLSFHFKKDILEILRELKKDYSKNGFNIRIIPKERTIFPLVIPRSSSKNTDLKITFNIKVIIKKKLF